MRSPAGLDATSCVAVELDGLMVGAVNQDVPLIPASNQKVLTGAVALEVLGPDYTYVTELRGAPVGGRHDPRRRLSRRRG